MREWTLNVVGWIAVLSIFAFITWRLADQFQPGHLNETRSPYTESYVEELILEKIYYEKSYNEIMEILGE